MTDRPASYQDIWDELAAGRLSTTVLAHLMRTDDVFRKWCERKVESERKLRESQEQQTSDEDMA